MCLTTWFQPLRCSTEESSGKSVAAVVALREHWRCQLPSSIDRGHRSWPGVQKSRRAEVGRRSILDRPSRLPQILAATAAPPWRLRATTRSAGAFKSPTSQHSLRLTLRVVVLPSILTTITCLCLWVAPPGTSCTPLWPFGWVALSVVAASVLFAWLFNLGQGSVIPVLVLHTAVNAFPMHISVMVRSDGSNFRPFQIVVVLQVWVAVVLLCFGGRGRPAGN